MTQKSLFPNEMQTLSDFQAFHRWLDQQKKFDTNLYLNVLLLMGELGEVTQVLKKAYFTAQQLPDAGSAEAHETALELHKEDLGQELADCLAYLLKVANYTGVNLEEAYVKKMEKNLERSWHK